MSAIRQAMTLMITTDSLASGAFVVDNSRQIISWNEGATRALGFDPDKTLGRTCEEMLALLHTQGVPICPDIADIPLRAGSSETPSLDPHAFRQQKDAPVRIRVVTQSGAPRWFEFSILHARKLDGAACVVHIFRDVTDEIERHVPSAVAANIAPHPGAIVHLPIAASGAARHGAFPTLTLEHLTPREHEVLELLAQGMATVEISTALGISRVTARNHVTRVIEKLGVKTRLQAVLAASHLGLI